MLSDELDKILSNVDTVLKKAEAVQTKKESLEKQITDIKKKFTKKKLSEDDYKKQIDAILKGKKEHDIFSKYNKEIRGLLKRVSNYNSKMMKLFEVKVSATKTEEGVIDVKEVREYLKRKKKKKDVKEEYTLYKKNFYGEFANQLFSEISVKLTKQYPDLFKDLYKNLRISNMKVFSDTYVNMGLLSVVLFFVVCFLFLLIFFGVSSLFAIFRYLLITIFLTGVFGVGFYFWPKIVSDGRRKEIKNDLPFAIMHLAAISGSGAPLVSAFDMLLKSGEYKALSGEIKKIMNYVNLFGYNLSTALHSVAETTPSKEFKELLNGMRGTIESGGSLKIYLKNKADDTFTNYKNDRKKYVETLSTYSDIYTAVLIAGPLLFIIVLVLVSLVGSKLGDLDIEFIEKIGIFFVLPAFNIAFVIFLNIVQPDL